MILHQNPLETIDFNLRYACSSGRLLFCARLRRPVILVFETKSLIILIFLYFLIFRVSSIFALLWCLVIFETKIDSFVKRLHLDTNRPDTDQIIDKKLIALPKDFDPNQPDPTLPNPT